MTTQPEAPDLKGKVAVVTGASRGIGRAVALGLAAQGAKVVVAAKSTVSRDKLPGSIHTVAEEITAAGGEALAVKVDVRLEEDVARLRSEVEQHFGALDILVHNAGVLWWRPIQETPLKRFDLVMNVNLRGGFLLASELLPLMRAGGHLIMVSPPVDLSVLGGRTAYLISKFGMSMLALGLSDELRDQQIAANTLWPVTAVESQATINHKIGDRRHWRKPSIMVDAVLEIVRSDPAELTGQMLLDEDLLRSRGWSDFTPYRCDPDHEPPRLDLSFLPKI